MWERLRSIWTIPDLRKKILFTLVMLLVFRVLAHITVPLTHTEELALSNLFSTNGNQNLSQLLGLLDVFSGGSLQQFSIVALGVYPYITATIVMQLLMPIIPALENMNREGEAGRLRFQSDHTNCYGATGILTGSWQYSDFCTLRSVDKL